MSNPNLISRLYRQAANLIQPRKNETLTEQPRAQETSLFSLFASFQSALTGANSQSKQALIYQDIEGLQVTKLICDYIDESVSNNPIISQAYSVFLNASDTEFELEIEVNGKGKKAKLKTELEDEFPRLFPGCYSLRDVSKFLMDKALSYGLISFQAYTDPETKELEFIFPPVWSLKWQLFYTKWQLIQFIKGQEINLSEDPGFVYKPLLPLRITNEGYWFIPPFKAGLKAAIEYDLLRESESQIARRTGMQVIFDVVYKVLGLPDWITKGSGQKESSQNVLNKITGFYQVMLNYLQNGFIMRTDEYDVKPLQTVEPPAHIQMFDQLFAQRVISGCKSYAPMIGYLGKENQTTLSSAQLKPVYNFCTSLQDTADHALKMLIFHFATQKGYVIKESQIKRQKPVLEGLLEYAKAEQILLAVEISRSAYENGQDMQTGGNEDINEVDNKNSNESDSSETSEDSEEEGNNDIDEKE